MAEESYYLKFDIDKGRRKELANGNFDLLLEKQLTEELNAVGKVKVQLEPDTKPGESADKELVLLILASGFTVSMVGNAVVKIMRAWANNHAGSADTAVAPTFEDETTFSAKGPGFEFKVTNKSTSG